ncbi:TonB-dependent receptor [Sphingorhabdus pulchriflava]|uniref:TonB-dependent receptor n=2 Tax=Sphingorhabdus pulchriflava TaxID=2292257 RepID=A0A371B4C8_9SPHN|nr:TonB-dependent receptor [Sphingorhabdus pulchriflava]
MAQGNFRLACASSISIAVALMAAPAMAQDSNADEAGLEEIVVTAQRREQSLQDVPMAISAVSGETLRDAGAIGIDGLANLVPSLATVSNNQPLAQSYRIRGLGTDPNIPTFEPSVALFIDGVYLPRTGLGVEDLVDIARIEVLKGPQSTLYGKNATAGVISVVSARPSDEFGGSVEASLSNIEGGRNATAMRFAGSLTGPLSDHVRVRLTGVYYDAGASFRNLAPGAEQANEVKRYALRGQAEFDLSDAVTLNLTAARSEVLDSNGINPDLYRGVAPEPSFVLDNNAALNALFGVTACPDNNPSNRIICTTDPNRSNSSFDMASATITADLGMATLTSITAWSQYESGLLATDIDQVSLPLFTFRDTQKGDSFSQEVRLVSPTGDTFEWLVGGYYLDTSFERGDRGQTPMFEVQAAAPRFSIPGAPSPLIVYGQNGDKGFLDSRASSKYFALFGQATYRFSDMFALTGGLRWQTETKKASINNRATFTPNPNLPAGHPLAGVNFLTAVLVPAATFPAGVRINGALPEVKDDNVTWNVIANFTPNDDTLIYASFARGTKSGGHNIGFGNAVPAQRGFGAEKVDNWELGGKFDLADRRARLAVSLFRSDYTNYQNAGFVGLQYLVNNADKVRVTGMEAEGTFRLADGLTMNLGGAYIDAKFRQYTGGACWFGRAPNANPTPTGVFTSCDLSGSQLPLAPKWRMTGALQYEHQLSVGELYARTDLNWQSKANVNSASLDPRHVQKAFALVNARMGMRFDNGLDLAFWASNLFDKTIVQQSGVLSFFGTTSGYQSFLGAPRQVGVTARFGF